MLTISTPVCNSVKEGVELVTKIKVRFSEAQFNGLVKHNLTLENLAQIVKNYVPISRRWKI